MISTQTANSRINTAEFKKRYKFSHQCPHCKEKIVFGIEKQILDTVKNYPYPHAILHGDPLHELIVYIDADFQVRSQQVVQSIEIARNSSTFNQILKKWSNPF